jgi:CRISPR system Cascade subunit CasE
MFLSYLLIDVGEDPDRPRPGRLWLRNLYHVHQRLCMAFPSESRKSEDQDFLKPYKPDDFAQGHVHTPRDADAGFLFRIDPQPGGGVVILVQSALKPDWAYAFHNADYLLAAPPQVKPFNLHFELNQRLRFRLVANPTRKIDTKSGPDGQRRNGKRVPVPADKFDEWLTSRAAPAGFSVEGLIGVQAGYLYAKDNKAANGKGQRLRSVRYDGVLKVTDPARFQETLLKGVGPGKAFGFGLLSVPPSSE